MLILLSVMGIILVVVMFGIGRRQASRKVYGEAMLFYGFSLTVASGLIYMWLR